jgi:hypothetical protein
MIGGAPRNARAEWREVPLVAAAKNVEAQSLRVLEAPSTTPTVIPKPSFPITIAR